MSSTLCINLSENRHMRDKGHTQGRSQDLVSGGGGHPFRGGGDPLFFASDPKSQVFPLMYFWLPPDFGGGYLGGRKRLPTQRRNVCPNVLRILSFCEGEPGTAHIR